MLDEGLFDRMLEKQSPDPEPATTERYSDLKPFDYADWASRQSVVHISDAREQRNRNDLTN
jgi:hypothetical protein